MNRAVSPALAWRIVVFPTFRARAISRMKL